MVVVIGSAAAIAVAFWPLGLMGMAAAGVVLVRAAAAVKMASSFMVALVVGGGWWCIWIFGWRREGSRVFDGCGDQDGRDERREKGVGRRRYILGYEISSPLKIQGMCCG